ncbi:hypothetical protein [Clostridium perfringens]|uniref:hypothetical protein n=1 Tax=Clostridium perfringens TaxID=1502 RepID=UPI0024BD2942|nr:hypothetical protein [Clostridium perfringens]
MSKLEMCSECHKYKSNLNDEGICAECEESLKKELKRAVILSFAMSASYLVKDMEELLKEYECDNELIEERLNKMREGIQHFKIFEIELKEVLREEKK